MSRDFLLKNDTAVRLFDAVRNLPVIDWHNHLSVSDLADDRRYSDLTELWIAPDPYKHRAMRICGVPERLITGNASSLEKFQAWSRVLLQLPGNPLYHWSKLELSRIFGIEEMLTPDNAERIWDRANSTLREDGFSARSLLERFHVEYAAPCVECGDPLSVFAEMKGVVPSLRGDDLLSLQNPLIGKAADMRELRQLLEIELKKLHDAGCRFADHALDSSFLYLKDDGRNEARFAQFKAGNLPEAERNALSCEILRFLAGFYAKNGWTLQLHVNALRNTSSRLRAAAGAAGGYAGFGGSFRIESLTALLDDLERSDAGMPDVILYTLNPSDHAAFSVLSGSFPGDGVRGKLRLGPAWWYCDHIHGMLDCFESVSAYGVLSLFPGMTTDSRSLLSFVRHEYFRRVFCGWLAEKAERDEFPDDWMILKNLAEAVCYNNAKTMIRAKYAGSGEEK